MINPNRERPNWTYKYWKNEEAKNEKGNPGIVKTMYTHTNVHTRVYYGYS